ncbi:G-protein coupled receptor Mth2-like isoform X7 [Rhodnius prolixus]|uniref:G-protein coupled receptor Mth2-like isoform X7 n=1 Tax=Rhodnius prolixus TaxID=13249 RepID=UPI003D188FF5
MNLWCSNFFLILLLTSINFCDSFNLRKCCPNDQAFNLDGVCINLIQNFTLPEAFQNQSKHIDRILPDHKPSCEVFLLTPEDNYTIISTGQLILDSVVFELDRYCIEYIDDYYDIALPLLCFQNSQDSLAFLLYSSGYFISSIFLTLTLIIYLVFPQLSPFKGKLTISYLFTILIAFICTAIVQSIKIRHVLLCKIFSFSVQYFFLATFFWLNVMCIDIYWAFSSVRTRGGRPGGDLRKLLLYSLYAWGMPLLILLATVAVDFSDAVPKMSPFKPNVGTNKCFFEGRSAAYLYFYGPMALLICANMVLFGVTAYRIWSTSRETAALNRGDSRRHSDKQENERFKLYVKLFLVMGINWAAELISFIVGEGVPHYLWYVTDLTNTLQGVFIFIIFVWKRRVRFALKTALCNKFTRGSTSSTISRKTISSRL